MITDMSPVIEPKSDQINADDFVAGPMTFKIERVDINPGTEQPVSITLADEKRVWRPCKTASRCLVTVWGPDAKAYVGRSVTLYRDPKVKWGGLEVGGIRVSHMSHMDAPATIMLTASKANRRPTVIKPLTADPQPRQEPGIDLNAWAAQIVAKLPSYATVAELRADWDVHKLALKAEMPDLFKTVNGKVGARGGELSMADGE